MQLREYNKEYFNKNLDALRRNYPGISEERLWREVSQLFNVEGHEFGKLSTYQDFYQALDSGIPLEYISNNAFFYRSNFYVNEDVLIPRSETEILVDDAVNFINKNHHSSFKVAEVGTGSFAIGLSTLIELDKALTLWAGDICSKALEISQINLNRMKNKIHPKTLVHLEISDRLNQTTEIFDLIVSNPPYIKKEADRNGVHHQADQFEPHIALYLEDENYERWFDEFFKDSANKLSERGALMMEGHEDSLVDLQKVALKYFKNVHVKKDYTGRDRFLHAFKN